MNIDRIVELVKTKHKRIGCRMAYKEFSIPEYKRKAFRNLWDLIAKDIDDAKRQTVGVRVDQEANKDEKEVQENGNVVKKEDCTSR